MQTFAGPFYFEHHVFTGAWGWFNGNVLTLRSEGHEFDTC